jgi:hypothetical protein
MHPVDPRPNTAPVLQSCCSWRQDAGVLRRGRTRNSRVAWRLPLRLALLAHDVRSASVQASALVTRAKGAVRSRECMANPEAWGSARRHPG